MTRVLVTSAASSPGLDTCRCLREDATVELVGADASAEGRAMAARLCHQTVHLPRADADPGAFADALAQASEAVDFVFVALDVEVEALAATRYPPTPNSLAQPEIVRVMVDKARTAAALGDALCPRSMTVEAAKDWEPILEELGAPLWVRPAAGTSGQAALCIHSAEDAHAWTALWSRRGLNGTWLAQEFLPGRNLNWTGLYRDGQLLTRAAMVRESYFLGLVAPSGVTGQVRRATTIVEANLDTFAGGVVSALAPHANGFFSIDLRENDAGELKVTEVNPRPAGRPWLYAQAGVNLPLAALRSARGESLGRAAGPLRAGVTIHRQLDMEALFTTSNPNA